MDNDNHHSTLLEFETSTEGIFDYELQKTNPWGITTTDTVFESDTSIIDGMYILYGMGGILIFFIVYTVCYSYCMHLKEKAERRRTELARINERLTRMGYNVNQPGEGRVFFEDINETNPNIHERTKAKTLFGVYKTTKNPRAVGNGSIFEPRPSSSGLQQNERRYFSDDIDLICPNNTLTNGSGNSRSALQSDGNDTEVKHIGWMSEPPLCFSSPQESKENILSEGNSTNLINENTTQTEKYGSGKPLEKDINITPTKTDGRRSPLPEGRSRSSPTSPDIVRRRFPSYEGTPRPSSWQ